MEFKEDLQMAIGLRYQALSGKQIDVVNGYSTDGMISALKLKRLKDDKNLWPPYYLAPVVRKEALDANPKMAEVLNQVSALLDEATMAEMNYKVDGEKEEPKDVARAFLKAKGIVQARRAARRPPRAAGLPLESRTIVLRRARRRASPMSSRVAREGATRRARRRGLATGSPRPARSSIGSPSPMPPIYGLTTALGANTGQTIAAGERVAYQERAVLARAVGVGPPLRDRCRAGDDVRPRRRHGAWAARAFRRRCSTRWSRCSTPACIRSCRASARSAPPISRRCRISPCR